MRLKWISWLRSIRMQQALSWVPQVAFHPPPSNPPPEFLRSRTKVNVLKCKRQCLIKEHPKCLTPLTSFIFSTIAKYLEIGRCCRFAKQSLGYEISLLLFKARCSFIPPNLQTKSSSTEVQYDTSSTTHTHVCEYYQQQKCASLIQKGGLVFVGHVLFSVVSFRSTIMKKAAFLEF